MSPSRPRSEASSCYDGEMPFDPNEHPVLSRRRAPVFRPSFTLAVVYLVGFFFLFAFLLVLPDLLAGLQNVAPGPAQEELAEEIARRAAAPRLPLALLLALGAVGLGAYLQVLPGLKRPS